MHNRVYRWLTAGAVATATTLGVSALAMADSPAPDNSVAPPAVEEFDHPGGSPYDTIKLLRGDGHIVATSCAGSYQIRVLSNAIPIGHGDEICFQANSASGFLTVEIPGTFLIRTEGRPVRATLDSENGTQVVNLAKKDAVNVGEASNTGDRSKTTLVELRVTG
ncbi:hypothetical protein [Kitasatospora purpeofusca]|uniref:hypothetical protein n=1 Tax=Kitasatospora purpeofusca TaxID=67352 RepID=UPI00366522FE